MPKGKRKGKFEHKRTEQYSSDEDAGIDMTIDNCSETSLQSDLKSNNEDQENEIQEKFEDKILELIEGLEARSGSARAGSWAALRVALQRRSVCGLLAPRRETLAALLARTLRRARDDERKPAAALAPLLALQIGEEGTDEFVNEVRPALMFAATDKSSTPETRAECCSSLAALCYLFEEDLTEILEVIKMYETIFSGSYLKGDGSVKVSGAAVCEGALHAAALDAWALVLALLPAEHAAALLRSAPPGYRRLADMLDACALDVRLAAGGALALAHERAAPAGAGLEPSDELLARLDTLARDSHKYRAKRDRKLTRATFRDIVKYFEEDEAPAWSVRVGADVLSVRSWREAAAYAALAGCLAGGLQALAPAAAPLRAALGLPDAPPPLLTNAQKPNKLQRHLQNSAACKARTVARSKNRDKRCASLAM